MRETHEQIALDWLDALRTIPVEEQKAWVIKTLRPKSMLHVFGRYFFPHIIKGVTPACHIELIQELSKLEDSAIIFPRGFAKSTWEKIDTIHDIVYALEPVILYISDTIDSAGLHFNSIKGELEGNEALRYVYGNLVPIENNELAGKARITRHFMKWTNKHFETTNGVNVVARGAGNGRGVNIRGNRPTKIVVDDAETDEQVKSVMRRQTYHDWLYNVIIPSLDKERGRIKVIGTVIHPECEVLQFYKAKGGIFKKAIEGVEDNNWSQGYSIWPTYWDIDSLLRLKDGYINDKGEEIQGIGTRAFMQEYMNEPTNMELARIKPEWIDDNMFTVLPENNKVRLRTVITIDPQSGESKGADEYAITVLGWYRGEPHKYVLEQVAGRGSQTDQVKQVLLLWLKYKETTQIVGIEKVMTQVAVFQLLHEWRNGKLQLDGVKDDDRNIPMQQISPGTSQAAKQRKGKDKIARFQMHEAAIERGELHLRPEMKQLREQILFLGTNTIDHDDRVDSLVMALDVSYQTQEVDDDTIDNMAKKSPTISGNLWRKKF